jgi:zinc protease
VSVRAPLLTIVIRLAVFAAVWATLSSGASAQTQNWPSEFLPRPLSAHEVKFPPYETRTLPNGLRVVAVLHHEQPVVSMRMIVQAGSALDPKGKLGLANLAASLLDQGTETKTAREVNDELDYMGGEMAAGAGPDLTFASMVVMKDSFSTGMQMLADMVRRPAFAQEEIERQRQQLQSGLQVSFEDPSFIADAVFNRLVYGSHPYGMPETGTPETLASITRDDLIAFHRRAYLPNNAIIAVVGDVTADEAFEGVTRAFGDWERRDPPAPTLTPPPNPARRIVIVNMPQSVQTEIRVGLLGIRRNQSDYMPLNLAMRILGGEGANRLHQILRTERGLTYGAQADMHTLRESGDFEAETSTRSEATGEVLRLIVDEIARLQRERVNERELSDAKAYLTGSFPLTIETPDAIATQILNVLFYGLPIGELQSFRERVNAVSPIDIERVARFYLTSERVSIVLVGNASAFTPQLRRLGFDNYDVIEAGDLDLTSSDFKRPRRRAALATPISPLAAPIAPPRAAAIPPALGYQNTPARGAVAPAGDARALIEKMVAAKGGVDTLRRLKTLKAVTQSELQGPSGPVTASVTTFLQYPGKVRVETALPGSSLVQVFDGERGWVRDGRTTTDVPAEAIREIRAGFKRDTVVLLLGAYDGTVRSRLLPDVKDESGALFHAVELSGLDLDPLIMYVDRETSLVAKQTYFAGGSGSPLVEELFSDYRPINGVQVAFLARVRSGGQPVLTRRVTDIQINPTFDAALFTRPVS